MRGAGGDRDAEGLPVPQRQQDVSLGLFHCLNDLVCLYVCGWDDGGWEVRGGGEGERSRC